MMKKLNLIHNGFDVIKLYQILIMPNIRDHLHNPIEFDQYNIYYEDTATILAKIYHLTHTPNEFGYKTQGHNVATVKENWNAQQNGASLLYGEFTVDGLRKALDDNHLKAKKATHAYDLGMGIGKASIQMFLEYDNLKQIIGIELSKNRYYIAERAAINLVRYYPHAFDIEKYVAGTIVKITKRNNGNKLIFKMGNLFDEQSIGLADFIIFDTDIPTSVLEKLGKFFSTLKDNCRLISYMNFDCYKTYFPYFEQLQINMYDDDRFFTSWSPQKGHRFFVWKKVPKLKRRNIFIDETIYPHITKKMKFINKLEPILEEYEQELIIPDGSQFYFGRAF